MLCKSDKPSIIIIIKYYITNRECRDSGQYYSYYEFFSAHHLNGYGDCWITLLDCYGDCWIVGLLDCWITLLI